MSDLTLATASRSAHAGQRSAAILAAAALVVEGVTVAMWGAVPDDHWGTRGDVVNGVFIVAALGLVAAVPMLTRLLALRRAGSSAVVATQAGFTLMAVESLVSQVKGGTTWGALFGLGLVLALLGSLVVAVDGVLAGRARWAAPLPLLGLLVGIGGGDHGGAVAWGLVWLVLGLRETLSDNRVS